MALRTFATQTWGLQTFSQGLFGGAQDQSFVLLLPGRELIPVSTTRQHVLGAVTLLAIVDAENALIRLMDLSPFTLISNAGVETLVKAITPVLPIADLSQRIELQDWTSQMLLENTTVTIEISDIDPDELVNNNNPEVQIH